jgi:hypothetical protein
MPITTPPTGQSTTGSLYLQLKTGYGFAELKVDDSGYYSQITRAYRDGGNNFYAYYANLGQPPPAYLTSGKYKFLIEKDISSYTTNDEAGVHLFSTFPYSYASVNLGSDEVYIAKGACNTTGTYSPTNNNYYTVDTRSAITYDDRNNFTVNATSGGKDSYGDFSKNIIVRNLIDQNNNSILGGNCNLIKNNVHSVIGGGFCSTITSYLDYLSIKYSNTIAGGYRNKILANSHNTIGGGTCNCTQGYNNGCNTIAGGSFNSMFDNVSNSLIAGGAGHCMENANASVIGGGFVNRICCNASYSVIAGGYGNYVCLGASVVGGGESNTISCVPNSIHGDSFIGAGKLNTVSATMSFLGAGALNQVGNCGVNDESNSSLMALGGGCNNYLLGSAPSMIGGICNEAVGHRATVGGGFRNCIGNTSMDRNNSNLFASLNSLDRIPESATIGGGQFNCILNGGCGAGILGGVQNKILSGNYSSVLGGYYNEIHGAMDSFILGSRGTISGYQITGQGGIPSGYIRRGMGLITDGTTRVFSLQERSLFINYQNGVYFTPSVNLRSVTYGPNNLLESVATETGFIGNRKGVYFGYTGGRHVLDIEGNFKTIQIGDLNRVTEYVDYSGDSPGTKTFIRRYNPSITIGNLNYGGHENILIGLNNNSYFQQFENTTGIGFTTTGITLKTITDDQKTEMPWAYPNSTWPYYQGRNVLVGHFNITTGTRNIVYGIQNQTTDTAFDNLLIGNNNTIARQGLVTLTGVSGVVTGAITSSVWNGWKSSNVLVGFGQVEQGGFHSISVGIGNQGFQQYSATVGINNNSSGTKNYTFGYRNVALGSYNSTFGNFNYSLNASGIANNLLGFYNLLDTGTDFVSLIGDRNNASLVYKGALLGGENVLMSANSSVGVGFRNTIFAGDSNVVGSNNWILSGNNNSIIFGNNNTSANIELGIFGHNNLNNGYQSYILGNSSYNQGEASVSLGYYARTNNYGEVAFAAGPIGSIREGSSQKTQLIWKGITSGNSLIPQELTLNGVFSSGNYISGKAFLNSGHIWNGTLNIVASETGLANIKTETRNITAINRNNLITIVNDQTASSASYGSPTWGMSVSGDSTNKALAINVTGASNKIILWNVVGEFNQIFVPTSESVNRYEFINGTLINNVIRSGTSL